MRIFGLPPIVTNAYVAVDQVPRDIREAADGMAMVTSLVRVNQLLDEDEYLTLRTKAREETRLIARAERVLAPQLGRQPTEEEVAKTMSISQTHLSLDAPLTPGEDNKILDYLADNVNPTLVPREAESKKKKSA